MLSRRNDRIILSLAYAECTLTLPLVLKMLRACLPAFTIRPSKSDLKFKSLKEPHMIYRKFGRTGLEVSDIAHGLWGMGGWSGSDDTESLSAMQLAVDLGCNFFDSAWAYGEGKSDGLLGKILAQNNATGVHEKPGKPLYAASKVPPKNLKWPASPKSKYSEVFPPEHVFKYADMIRRQMGVDTIDLLQFHVWSDTWADDPDFGNTVDKLKQ